MEHGNTMPNRHMNDQNHLPPGMQIQGMLFDIETVFFGCCFYLISRQNTLFYWCIFDLFLHDIFSLFIFTTDHKDGSQTMPRPNSAGHSIIPKENR